MNGTDLVARRGLPSAFEIERYLLASILVADSPNELFQAIGPVIGASDFTTRKHQAIFEAIAELERAGSAIDRGTLYNALKGRGELDLVGGLSGILDLEDGMPAVSAGTVESWVGILREKTALRRIISACDGAIVQAMAGNASEAILAETDRHLSGIADDGADEQEWRSPLEIMQAYPGGWQAMVDPPRGGSIGVSLPWASLSEDLCGLRPGELILVGARPGMGKSVFGMQTAYHVARGGTPVAVFSMEMTGESLVKRLIAAEGRLDSHLMRHGHLRDEDKRRARAAVVEISDMPLYIDQRPHNTLSMRLAVKRLQRRLKAEGRPPLGLIVVDHFHLFSSIHPSEQRREMFARSADDLMRGAKEFDAPIMALCQVGRGCEDEQREPQKSDLSETGKLEQNAHVIIFLHRPEEYPKYREREDLRGLAWAIVAKQREGPIGSHQLVFLKSQQRFEEAA